MEDLVNMGIISIIPAVLAIVLSFATKNTITALAIACFTGTTLVGVASGTPIVETLLLGFPTLLKENLGNTSFSWVMLLNTFIGILVAYFQKTGAIQGFSQWVHDKKLSRKGAQLMAWVLGMFVYFSDSFSPLFVGCTMRSITDKARISREKLAYIADSTSAPVSVLVPITGWAAYLSGLAVGVGCIATQEDASALFLKAIPFNFYPIFAVILVGLIGSSWGTFAICMPIALPMAFSMTGGQLTPTVVAVFAAVAGGGVFGDHCSPLSDTTILSSMGSAADHLDHVKTQLPYALTCGALAAVAYLILGFAVA